MYLHCYSRDISNDLSPEINKKVSFVMRMKPKELEIARDPNDEKLNSNIRNNMRKIGKLISLMWALNVCIGCHEKHDDSLFLMEKYKRLKTVARKRRK